MTLFFGLHPASCICLQKKKALDMWRGLASFLGLVPKDVATIFISVVTAFDDARPCPFSHALFKEYSTLTAPYWTEFVTWLDQSRRSITVTSMAKELKRLRRLQNVRTHILCPDNDFVHPDRSM